MEGVRGDSSFLWSRFTDVCMNKYAVNPVCWLCVHAPQVHT